MVKIREYLNNTNKFRNFSNNNKLILIITFKNFLL